MGDAKDPVKYWVSQRQITLTNHYLNEIYQSINHTKHS